ncbi:MAG: VWA domain-containing protein [Planctomycetota bacterium]
MSRRVLHLGLLPVLLLAGLAGPSHTRPNRGTVVEVGIVLDDSAGMAPWQDAARIEIGRLLLEASRWRPGPQVRLGLVVYGNDDETRARVVHDLGEDVDGLLDVLGRAEGRGGVEDVTTAIERAREGLGWSRQAPVQVLVLIGNESPHQVPGRDPRDAARAAARDGLVVHVLYAGREGDLFEAEWQEIAQAGGGELRRLSLPRRRTNAARQQAAEDDARLWSRRLLLPPGATPRLVARHARVSQAFGELGEEAVAVRRRLVAAGLVLPPEDLVLRHERGELDLDAAEGWPPELEGLTPAERRVHLETTARRRAEARAAWRSAADDVPGGPPGALADLLAAQARAAGFTRSAQPASGGGR